MDVDNPPKLPLCWYGVKFLDKLVFDYTKRIGIAKYMRDDLVKLKAGDLDILGTWANFVGSEANLVSTCISGTCGAMKL